MTSISCHLPCIVRFFGHARLLSFDAPTLRTTAGPTPCFRDCDVADAHLSKSFPHKCPHRFHIVGIKSKTAIGHRMPTQPKRCVCFLRRRSGRRLKRHDAYRGTITSQKLMSARIRVPCISMMGRVCWHASRTRCLCFYVFMCGFRSCGTCLKLSQLDAISIIMHNAHTVLSRRRKAIISSSRFSYKLVSLALHCSIPKTYNFFLELKARLTETLLLNPESVL